MDSQVLLLLALTLVLVFLTILVSVSLVVYKSVNARRLRKREALYSRYAETFAQLLSTDLPELPADAKTSARFQQYEKMIRPIKETLESSGRRTRTFHRAAIRLVLVDFARDLSAESGDRLVYFFYAFGFVEDQITLMGDRRWWIRAQSARDVGSLRARKAISALTVCLEDRHEDVRTQSMLSLVALAGISALRTIFRITPELSQWDSIALSIAVMKYREEAIPFLLEGLTSHKLTIAVFCIEMLAEIGLSEGVEHLRDVAIQHPRVEVRAKAVEALGRINDQRAESLLVELLASPFPLLRKKAAEALGKFGSPALVGALQGLLLQGTADERITVARAIAACGTRGRDVLDRARYSVDDTTRRAARHVFDQLFPSPPEGARDHA